MTPDAIKIDGSHGEGGGQIIRTSMALAIVTQRSVCIENIRARRSKPGLKRQHLTAVRAASEICDGDLTGDEINSTEIWFQPGRVRSGEFRFSIGTAGSSILVLQTVLPPLLTADGPSTLILEGGTHNQWAPTFDFLNRAYLPLVNRMGVRVKATLERHGFYPAGGGRVVVHITPSPTLAGFDLTECGRVVSQHVTAIVSKLPSHIGVREIKQATRKLNWRTDLSQNLTVDSAGPGNVVTAFVECENVCEVFTAIGRQGIAAEKVADEVVRATRRWKKVGAPVGEYLADQILLPLALSAHRMHNADIQRGGTFRTGPLSLHARTHVELLQEFLNIKIEVSESDGVTTCSVLPKN